MLWNVLLPPTSHLAMPGCRNCCGHSSGGVQPSSCMPTWHRGPLYLLGRDVSETYCRTHGFFSPCLFFHYPLYLMWLFFFQNSLQLPLSQDTFTAVKCKPQLQQGMLQASRPWPDFLRRRMFSTSADSLEPPRKLETVQTASTLVLA